MNIPPGACVDVGGGDYIAGWNKRGAWQDLRARLVPGRPDGWAVAFTEFYKQRIDLRYLHPIKVMQDHGTLAGEGFAIATIQCSLIEFLESAEQGINYRYRNPGQHEYSDSRSVFVSFLTKRQPFADSFTIAAAEDFYASVRCGLLHEAQTKNGWRIWGGKALQGQIVDVTNRIVNRDGFHKGLLKYVDDYESRLPIDPALQAAFIRKFDNL